MTKCLTMKMILTLFRTRLNKKIALFKFKKTRHNLRNESIIWVKFSIQLKRLSKMNSIRNLKVNQSILTRKTRRNLFCKVCKID